MSLSIRSYCALLLTLTFVSASPAAAPPGNLDRDGDPLPRGAIARLGSLRFRLDSPEIPIAMSSDGKRVILWGSRVIDAITGRTLLSVRPPEVEYILVSNPAGDAALFRKKEQVTLYDLNSGTQRWSREVGEAASASAVFDPTGKHFACLTKHPKRPKEGQITVHRTDTGKQLDSFSVNSSRLCFALSPDRSRLLTWDMKDQFGPRSCEATVWDTATGKKVTSFPAQSGPLSVAYRPDGKELATALGNTVVLLDSANFRKRRSFQSAGYTQGLTYSPDGRYLGAVGGRCADLWDVTTGKRLPTRNLPEVEQPAEALAIAVTSSGQFLVARNLSPRELVLTDARSGRSWRTPGGHDSMVMSLFFDANEIHTAGWDGHCITWDFTGRQRRKVRVDPIPPWQSEFSALEFSSCGRWLVGGAQFVYDRRAGELRFEDLGKLADAGNQLRIASAASVMVGARDAREGTAISAIRLDTGEQLWSTKDKTLLTRYIAISPDGSIVALVLSPKQGPTVLRLLDGRTGKVLKGTRDRELARRCHQLEVSLDGRMLVIAAEENEMFFLDARTGDQLHHIKRKWSSEIVAICPQCRTIAVDDRGGVDIYEIASGKVRLWFSTPRERGTSLKFSEDGKYLGSGLENGTALIWDLEPERTNGKKEDAWKRLAGTDAEDAYRAIWQLRRDPASAIALVRKHIKPSPPGLPDSAVKKLIASLDVESYATRQQAQEKLSKQGRSVEAALRKTLAAKPSLEMTLRIRRLLNRLPSLYAQSVVSLRAVELLERIGSKEAQELLRELAKGNASSIQTIESKAAFARLSKQSKQDVIRRDR